MKQPKSGAVLWMTNINKAITNGFCRVAIIVTINLPLIILLLFVLLAVVVYQNDLITGGY